MFSASKTGSGSLNSSYQIERSLRFFSTTLNRTPVTPSNRKTYTLSFWVKNTQTRDTSSPTGIGFWGAGTTSSNSVSLLFTSTQQINFIVNDGGVTLISATTDKTYLDASSWYHIVLSVDTTQATNSNGVKIYVNGSLQTLTFAAYTQNTDTQVNNAIRQTLGDSFFANNLDGYMAEINFIDGQALAASSFGENNAATDQWRAIGYSGAYGSLGYYLNFSNGTSTTTFGYDTSGNGNNFTPVGFSATPTSVNYSWMLDAPPGNSGATATQPNGNYAVLNPATNLTSTAPTIIRRGGLQYTGTSTADETGVATMYWSGDKNYYCEIQASTISSNTQISLNSTSSEYVKLYTNIPTYFVDTLIGGIGTTTNTAIAYANSDTIQIAYNSTNGKVWIGINNTYLASGSPSTQTNPIATFSSLTNVYSSVFGVSATLDLNFGQRPFVYTPPTGFVSLCTPNFTSDTLITSGSFNGNLSSNGPRVWCNGTPVTLTINGNAVTFGTHASKLANGFKVTTSSTSYNNTSNSFVATYLTPAAKSAFKNQNAKGNP